MKRVIKKIVAGIIMVIALALLVQIGSDAFCQAKGVTVSSEATKKSNKSTINKAKKKTTKISTKTTKSRSTKTRIKKATVNTVNTNVGALTIKCVGDSVTEGMGLPDAHTAVLDGATYPSVLYTLLKKDGIDAKVENAGHGGEKTAAIVSRLGNVPLILNEKVVFDSSGKSGPINGIIIADYGEDLMIPVTFTYTATDINPLNINGKQYKAVSEQDSDGKWKLFLYKESKDTTSVLAAGTEIQLGGTKNNDISIIYAGANDGEDITIDKYVQMLKKGVEACGDKYIIVGAHIKIYDRKNFIEGKSSAERRNKYRDRMFAEFGNHFIDLNTDWCERAVSIAQQNGMLTDLSTEQLTAIQSMLDNREMPAEFTINNKNYGWHFNKAGYTGVAQLIYERMIELGYVSTSQ